MDTIRWKSKVVIDSHVHYLGVEPLPHFYKILELVNYTGLNMLALPGPGAVAQNAIVLERKAERPEFFYAFGCLEHDPNKVASGDGGYLAEQATRIMDRYDGIKMLEGKPAVRRSYMPRALDHAYFAPFFARVAELNAPVTLHVSDPVDAWVGENSYRDLDPQEEYFRQAEAVLKRHPSLRINFPHFMYLSPQLDRLAGLFDRYPGIMTDLAMGSEFLYYLSDNPDRGRDFFVRFQDRILYGTDINDRNALKHARSKAEVLRLFLETSETFYNLTELAMNREPSKGSNGRVELRGLALPDVTLDKVMGLNFQRFVSRSPKPLPASAVPLGNHR